MVPNIYGTFSDSYYLKTISKPHRFLCIAQIIRQIIQAKLSLYEISFEVIMLNKYREIRFPISKNYESEFMKIASLHL